jgi:SpoVK/Ycf46/Vps4 family AAA+-type ATPase
LVIELPMPDRDTRREIFAVHTQGKPLAPDVDLETLADLTEGLVGGDIAAICRRATMQAIRDHVQQSSGEPQGVVLSARHFQHALEAVIKASQYARALRLAREGLGPERTAFEQQRSVIEAQPTPQRSTPLA